MPVEVGINYIHIRVKNSKLFKEKSFRTKWLSKKDKIKAIFGKLKKGNKMDIQLLMFDRKKWKPEDIVDWLKSHKFNVKITREMIEKAINKREKEELKEKLKGKEI